ncbi:MAG: Asp-tRNA(Asn)/Glu-tRNA(Gln) amidotransferase subunit GatB [Streptococcaceae bacterium]|jgi:aspartyl-tRNA(Asn)/glutamyl-tRNA(Gln) amidotransferase subunit B|nr:Asp-tRNA(Asn)/Glu-tRNA(Gln) amidotransferase subunit GatB [Streptococcaceae bacterium]
MNFETVIGLEVHVELNTNSKAYSPSYAHFKAEPNTNTNVIDWGYPGVLPVVNKKMVEFGIKAALALNMKIAKHTHFDRKNYFYPDTPKAYQISQFDKPIGYDGWLEIEVQEKRKKIRIERVHLEEDAGKSIHDVDGYSCVDLNRQGVPLIEIVSKADMRSAKEAYAYLEALKSIIQFIGISDVKMEEGSMRVDANISLRAFGEKKFGVKTELKNLNSFSNVRKGLIYEQKRQEKVLRSGGVIYQETRRFDDITETTILMRVKEGSSDYRYFPEPDLPKFVLSDEWIEKIKQELPELPAARRKRYVNDFNLPEYDAKVLTLNPEMANFFEATLAKGADAKKVSNWLMGEVSHFLNAEKKELKDLFLTPENFSEMIQLIDEGTLSSKMGKKVFLELAKKGGSAREVVKKQGLVQLSDPLQLLLIIQEVLANNEQSVKAFKAGKNRALKALMGQIMKITKGQANPALVNKLLLEEMAK